MKILFKNNTKYSKEIYTEYLSFHRKKYNLSYRLYTGIVIFLILMCIVFQVQYHYYTLAITSCFVLTAFFLWQFIHPEYEVAKEYQSDKIINESEFSFIFYNKYFKVVGKKQFSNCKYYKLHKVFETDDFFYLYLDKNHALLLKKDGFTIGNSENFSTFIEKKVLWKYSRFKDKKASLK